MPVTLEMLIALLGRTHPLALHLPIGIFAALALLEGLAWLQGRRLESHVRTTLVASLVLVAAWSVASGLLLASEPGYAGTTLDRHKILGIAFGAGTLLLLGAAATGRSGVYRAVFVACAIVMTLAGHLGATITHGDDFLTAAFRTRSPRDGVASRSETSADGVASAHATGAQTGGVDRFRDQIMPVLATTCVGCHNATKARGGLALHDIEAIRRGGDTGHAVTPGDPANSEILVRMKLPLEHDDHMPPKNKPQPTPQQVALIEAWIREGAPMGAAANRAAPGTSPASVPAREEPSPPAPVQTPVQAPRPAVAAPASPEAIAALRDALLHVEHLEPGPSLLSISTGGADGLDAPRLAALLAPVVPHVGTLDLSRLRLDAEVMRRIAAMMSLRRLNLSQTTFSDEDLAIIAPTSRIETLVASQTRLSSKAAELLGDMPSLRALFAWRTGLTEADVTELISRGVRVDLGASKPGEPLETEDAPTLTSNATPGGAQPATAAKVTAVNSICPVAGKPVNPDVIVVFKGRAVGFCCTRCAGTFLADPAAYEAKIR
ncbi:MAG: c-type cytochrome domain-containing protein [Phycisphaerae bacterium]